MFNSFQSERLCVRMKINSEVNMWTVINSEEELKATRGQTSPIFPSLKTRYVLLWVRTSSTRRREECFLGSLELSSIRSCFLETAHVRPLLKHTGPALWKITGGTKSGFYHKNSLWPIKDVSFKMLHRFYPTNHYHQRLEGDINLNCSFCGTDRKQWFINSSSPFTFVYNAKYLLNNGQYELKSLDHLFKHYTCIIECVRTILKLWHFVFEFIFFPFIFLVLLFVLLSASLYKVWGGGNQGTQNLSNLQVTVTQWAAQRVPSVTSYYVLWLWS